MGSRYCLGVVALTLAATGCGGTASPTGTTDAQGAWLMSKVLEAYRHVPAVAITGSSGALHVRFTILLRDGVIVGEQFVGSDTTLVGRAGGPTYAREPGTRCWRRLAQSDQQSFSDLGTHFPGIPHMRVHTPKRVGSVWLLPITAQGHDGTFRINASTLQIESVTVKTADGRTAVEHDRALAHAPALVTPRPLC